MPLDGLVRLDNTLKHFNDPGLFKTSSLAEQTQSEAVPSVSLTSLEDKWSESQRIAL